MKIRKVLKLSFPAFMAMGIKTMLSGDESIPLMVQARQAVAAVKSMKAIYEGDTENGFLFAGQNVGGIKDVPTVKELIERTVAEAEQVMDALQKKRVS